MSSTAAQPATSNGNYRTHPDIRRRLTKSTSAQRATSNWNGFLADIADVLGPEGFSTDPATLARAGMNLTKLPPRAVPAILWPRTRAQVERLVKLANLHACPLQPFSTGMNWGMGSRLPQVDGCVLVDLRRMDRILEVNERFRYAVIEPGVTQGQLARHLTAIGSACVLNVTGAGPATSITGNTLDRGVGMYGQRTQDLRGLEVVLGQGRTIRTGYWHFHQCDDTAQPPIFYSHGVGPDLNGLFSQSNFGIVTALVIGLHPKAARHITALLACDEGRMPALIDALSVLRRDGVIQNGLEVDSMNDHRMGALRDARSRGRQWFAWVTVAGVGAMLEAGRKVLEETVQGIVHRLEVYDSAAPDSATFPDHPRIRFDYLSGNPNAFSIRAFGGKAVAGLEDEAINLDLVDAAPGLSLVLPAVPFDGQWAAKLARIVDEVSAAYALDPAMTLCGINTTALEGFIRLGFNRSSPEAAAKVHRWNEELHARLVAAGLPPYRVPVDRMGDIVNRPDDTFWQTVVDLKRALDPAGIIAPGKYAPV